MTALADLIKRDNITATWFWTHEVSTGPYTEYEVWDVVFVRDTDEPQKWVTDGATRRTLYIQGIPGSVDDSRRMTGGERREPDTAGALADLLADAIDVDNNPTFRAWVEDTSSERPAWDLFATYELMTARRNKLRTWLGDAYDEYVTAYS